MPVDRTGNRPSRGIKPDLPAANAAQVTTKRQQKPTKAAAAKGRPNDSLSRGGKAHDSLSIGTTFTTAQSLGKTVNNLRAGLMRALSTEMLITTDLAVEVETAKAVQLLRAGELDVESFVTKLLADGGPLAVADAVASLAWRIDAALADLPAGEQDRFAHRGGDTLEKIVTTGIQKLAVRRPTSVADAVATMVAQSALLSAGQDPGTAYFAKADTSYGHHFDAFTNEKNLPGAISELPASGGGMLGVSGAAVHTAAQIRADAALVADINPEVRDFVLVLGATSLCLDERARTEGWSDERFVAELQQRILGPQRGSPALIAELREAGLPQPVLERTPRMLQNIYNENGINPRMIWFATHLPDKGYRGADVELPPIAEPCATRVAESAALLHHVAELTRRGGLVAATTDLADTAAAARQSVFFSAHDAPVSVFHLSNALDYVLDPVTAFDSIASLPAAKDSIVVSSCAGQMADRRMGDWHKPGVNPLGVWTAPDDGIRNGLVRMADAQAERIWVRLLVEAYVPFDRQDQPKAFADVQADVAKRISEHYADPDKAKASLLRALGIGPNGPGLKATKLLEKMGVAPPRDPDELRALTRKLHTAFDGLS